jgi:hypothetical protein
VLEEVHKLGKEEASTSLGTRAPEPLYQVSGVRETRFVSQKPNYSMSRSVVSIGTEMWGGSFNRKLSFGLIPQTGSLHIQEKPMMVILDRARRHRTVVETITLIGAAAPGVMLAELG